MSKLTRTYLSLGSNQGNKFEWLQKATCLLFERVGTVSAISPLYSTPSWGFEGADFLNLCVAVHTRLEAEQVIAILLAIENELGRERNENSKTTYQNRTIDIDILFFGTQILAEKNLKVPHPKMHERRFVLAPLADIAEDVEHPELKVTVKNLLDNCPDTSEIHQVEEQLEKPGIVFADQHYISIEGNIGAGKTSLSSMIAEDFNAKLILEGYKDNPFLPKFYEAPKRYAFPLEMSFLAERYQQMLDDVGQYDLFSEFVISDYEVSKSLIFAEITLQDEEYTLYKRLFHIMHKNLTKPDLYVYLYQDTARLLQNIKKRGRDYERDIDPEYLEKINRSYLDFIKNQSHWKVKIIDVSSLDFVQNRADYLKVLREIAMNS